MNTRTNHDPNMWGMWNKKHITNILWSSEQCLALSCNSEGRNSFIESVYANTYHVHRRQLWTELYDLQRHHVGPWTLLGDFNASMGSHEMIGGSYKSLQPAMILWNGLTKTTSFIWKLKVSNTHGPILKRVVIILVKYWIELYVMKIS